MGIKDYINKKTASKGANIVNDRRIRMVYANMFHRDAQYSDLPKLSQEYYISATYRLPKNMTLGEACKVVSYLSEKIEKEDELIPASVASVMLTSESLEGVGFKKLHDDNEGFRNVESIYDPDYPAYMSYCPAEKGVVDLFTVANMNTFKKTQLMKRYFEWFTPNITKEEIEEIYKNLNLSVELEDYSSTM